ncbi:MAG: PspC domain-containing protein, partial [Solirubrobacterales bacterium]|nr:PspC domain-containing protein [Solirubrobacterales bacterium]
MTNTPQKNQSNDPSRGRLLRSPSERMVAGVAGGTAQYLGVDPTFVRLGFVVASLFGGFGLLAYLVMTVVVPQDDGTGNPVEGRPPTWAIVLLAIVALIVLPGPFFGWGDGWFFGVGMLWLVALIGVSVLAYRAVRGEDPLFGSGSGGDASEAKTQTSAASGGGDG